MIYFRNVYLSYLDKVLFDKINWTINPRSRIGLVGDNGTGKTTLFRTILNKVQPDDGFIEIPDRKSKKIGYLPQDLIELPAVKVIDYLKEESGIAQLENALHQIEEEMSRVAANDQKYLSLSQKYSDKMTLYNTYDGYSFEARAGQILKGFGFKAGDAQRDCSEFSGGWKMRILLSSILMTRPDIMLLDEPTNHLDTESMEWLENYLKDFEGTLIAISHDRFFLDKIATQIAELSSGHILIYKGNYSHYLREKEKRREALLKEMELQRAQIKKIETFVERFRYKATKASQVQSRVKMIERFKEVNPETKTKTVKMKFPESQKSAREVVKAIDLGQHYPDINVFSHLNFTLYRGDKVAFVGINGSGKSTLSRLLSKTEKPFSGTIQYGDNVKMAFFSQESAENLDYGKSIWEEVNSVPTKANDQEKRDILGAFLFSGDDILKPISVLSGGEKSRLALLKIMLTDTNFLILDEPTNHLDIKTKDIFQEALLQYHGTVAIVSHDRYFLDCLVNKVFELREGCLITYEGNYSYFIEKRLAHLETVQASAKNNHQPVKFSVSARNKEKKRQDAEERNKIYKIRSALKKELTEIENEIKSLESKKTELESLLCDPLFLKDATQVKNTQISLNGVNSKLEQYYHKWQELEDNFENLKIST